MHKLGKVLLSGCLLVLIVLLLVVVWSVRRFDRTHERREMTLLEIERRTGLDFPQGTVLVGSYLDFFLQGRSWAARIEIPRARFHQFRASLPKDAHDVETQFFPKDFYGKDWWTPQRLKPFLRVGYGHNGESVMLLADKRRGDAVEVLIHGMN